MTHCSITIEAYNNGRITKGLFALESHWSCDEGFAISPGPRHFDLVLCTLDNLDLGRYDAEGDSYIADLLDCVPGDIISTTLED